MKLLNSGYKYFTLVEARFSGKSVLPVFTQREKYKLAKIEKKLSVQILSSSCLNFFLARFD